MIQIDGKALLLQALRTGGYESLEQAVAEMTLFIHPKTVAQTGNRNVFRTIRNFPKRGEVVEYPDPIGKAMACDNEGPANTFRWTLDRFTFEEVQYNHIYSDSQNIEIYTSLANICVTPAFLAKLTDKDKDIQRLLRYRSYDLYGFTPKGTAQPSKPEGYDKFKWRVFPDPVAKLESAYRRRLEQCPKSRTCRSAREIGWLFSDFKPDATLQELKAA